MCSYCGCEAEPVIKALMEEHASIALGVRRARMAIVGGRTDEARAAVAALSDELDRHSRGEEAGLFAQLKLAGEALDEVRRLEVEHVQLRCALADVTAVTRPEELEDLFELLTRHAETEDDDLFPFALQRLPDRAWAAVANRDPSPQGIDVPG